MKPVSSPVRTCIGCGQRGVQASLLRVQVDARGELVLVEIPGSGRSAYLHARQVCVGGLLRSKGLTRSLRMTIGREPRQRAIEEFGRNVESGRGGWEAGTADAVRQGEQSLETSDRRGRGHRRMRSQGRTGRN